MNPQQLYESVRNSPEHLGNWGQCNFAREISTLFPGYFLTFLEAWGQGNIVDDVRILSESFSLQSVNYSLRFSVCSLPANVRYRVREAIRDFKQDYGGSSMVTGSIFSRHQSMPQVREFKDTRLRLWKRRLKMDSRSIKLKSCSDP